MRFSIIIILTLIYVFPTYSYQVYFSPQSDLEPFVVNEVKKARHQIDLSIYTFRSQIILDAIVEKIKSNSDFKVRVLIRKSNLDHLIEFLTPLEEALTDLPVITGAIRYVTVTNHHKFIIVDNKTLINTSGNFNESDLAKTYDENLVICSRSCSTLVKAFQNEFDYLYENSNFLFIKDSLPKVKFSNLNDATKISDVALFTSENFYADVNSKKRSFKLKKQKTDLGWVEKNLIDKINKAKKSVYVATGHFRSWSLAKALAQAAKRGVKVEVMLDSQEYISKEAQDFEDHEAEACIKAGKIENDCLEVGYHFGRWLFEEGVSVYFKYYMVFWDFIKAPQMHHKYMIVDEDVVYTGSYNWSKNAEFKTFENVSIIKNIKVVKQFLKNFNELKSYGIGKYTNLMQSWKNETNKINLVFDPMSLNVDQIDQLRITLASKCKDIFTHVLQNKTDQEEVSAQNKSNLECQVTN